MNEGCHKAGFVNIVGNPNVGKSTLMNVLVGEKLSIITSKVQTTRHRILGIISGDDFQIVYSDTPGILKPKYVLQKSMMKHVYTAIDDADIILFVVDIFNKAVEEHVIKRITNSEQAKFLIINKIDLAKDAQEIEKVAQYWQERINPTSIIPISALKSTNIDTLFDSILSRLPCHPAYYPKNELTDRPERFFVAEIIREKIFVNYKKEVPYSCEVIVTDFEEKDKIIRIRSEIYVERPSQRAILLGHKGERMKKVGIEARKDIENFFGKQVFLEQHIKIETNWRKNDKKLNQFGYLNS